MGANTGTVNRKECTRYRECIRYGENIIKIEQYILCCIVCNVTVIYCEYHYFHFLDTTYMSSLPRPLLPLNFDLRLLQLSGWGLNYTIQRFTPALTGRKECRGTLFPASVTREIVVSRASPSSLRRRGWRGARDKEIGG